jgi:hypothetical protein
MHTLGTVRGFRRADSLGQERSELGGSRCGRGEHVHRDAGRAKAGQTILPWALDQL